MKLFSWSLYGVLCLVLAGCGMAPVLSEQEMPIPSRSSSGPVGVIEQTACHPEPLTGTAAQVGPFSVLTPAQSLSASAKGSRVCWGGGLRTIEVQQGERGCVVMLHANLSAETGWSWPRESSFFMACGPGHYDRELLRPFTLGSVSGKVTGRAEFAGSPIPVIEIDAFYRASDCLEGATAPQCVHGYIQPQKKLQ